MRHGFDLRGPFLGVLLALLAGTGCFSSGSPAADPGGGLDALPDTDLVPADPGETEVSDPGGRPDLPDADPGPADPGTPDPGTPDPGTPDPGTLDPGTPDPGTPDPGTPDPGSEVIPPECTTDLDCRDVPVAPCHYARCGASGTCETGDFADGTLCDDGNPATRWDACREGQCAGSPADEVTVRGVVWRYYCMFCNPDNIEGTYYMEPAGGVAVRTDGVSVYDGGERTTVTSEDGCSDWWVPGAQAACGQFEVRVPRGSRVSLVADGEDPVPGDPETGHHDGRSILLRPESDTFVVMVLAQRQLVSTLATAWKVTPDPAKGMVVGLAARMDPDSQYLFSDFQADVTVSLTPAPANADFRQVYFDSKTPASTARKGTDPAQPLFFAANLPASQGAGDYTAKATGAPGSTLGFDPVNFRIAPDTLTYVPASPTLHAVGRVWGYTVKGLSFQYDPVPGVPVAAFEQATTPLAQAETGTFCTAPWDPREWDCGAYDLPLPWKRTLYLHVPGSTGFLGTLTRLFSTDTEADLPGVIVLVQRSAVDLLSTLWGVELDPAKGHLVVMVAGMSVDPAGLEGPFSGFVGDATVRVQPAIDSPDFRLAYYDPADPLNLERDRTAADLPLVVAVNLPARGADAPYHLSVEHATLSCPPADFPIQPGTVTYVVMSPE